MKSFLKVFFSALIMMTAIGTTFAKQTGLDKIKRAGTLTVGVKDDVPGFGFMNPESKKYEGLEIDIAKAIAKKIFGSEDKVTFLPVNAKNRGPFLNQDRVDLVIATFTVTEERKQLYDFSDIYYTDSVGIMVKKSSGITSFKNLENKKIGVTQGSMTTASIKNAAIKEGVLLNCVNYPSNQTLKDALDHNEIDAFCIDASILHGYLDDSVTILPEHYDEMMYAVAIKKDNTTVTKVVNEVIRDLVKSGELDKILAKYGLKF
ncbi:transporter substrate-binding domain-containing protein [Treponema sp.]|uniref:transporter substrate-binding domain-containing protein n=1 Tax=Treponema sp. TaxID=166 RepID=UPI00388E01A6